MPSPVQRSPKSTPLDTSAGGESERPDQGRAIPASDRLDDHADDGQSLRDNRGENQGNSLDTVLGVDGANALLSGTSLAGLIGGITPIDALRQKSQDPDFYVPKTIPEWIFGMIAAHGEKREAYLQRIPGSPPHADVVKAMNEHTTLSKLVHAMNRETWDTLEQYFPSWLENREVIGLIHHHDRVQALEYIALHHAEFLRSTMGLQKDEQGQWRITPTTVDGTTGDRWFTGLPLSTETARRLGAVWPAYRDQADRIVQNLQEKAQKDGKQSTEIKTGSWMPPQYLSGAERLAVSIEVKMAPRVGQWLWDNVVELRAYRNGDPTPWREAVRMGGNTDEREADAWLGRKMLAHALGTLAYNGQKLGQGNPDDDRAVLGHPAFRDEDTFRRMIPQQDYTVYDLKTLNNAKHVARILSDPSTCSGMMNIIRSMCRQTRMFTLQHMSVCPELGWSGEQIAQVQVNHEPYPGPGGLVEAAVLHGANHTLSRLLETPAGANLIIQVLKQADCGARLSNMGSRNGWRKLASWIRTTQEADWSGVRDEHGNTVAHWVAYGYNRIDKRVAIKEHEALARQFPDLMQVRNDQGYTPVDFMPREHADRIARRMIQRAGKRTSEEKKQAQPTRTRTL